MSAHRMTAVSFLAEIADLPKSKVQGLVSAMVSQRKRTAACAGHLFVMVSNNPPQYRCRRCQWAPTAAELSAYKQGLEHGQKRLESPRP